MRIKYIAAFLLILLGFDAQSQRQDLSQRKALIGVLFSNLPDAGLVVDSVVSGGTFDAMSVKKGDKLLAVNEKPVKTLPEFGAAVGALRRDEGIHVTVERGDQKMQLAAKGVMRPLETQPFADIFYDYLPFREGKLRIITKKPTGKARCPSILFIPGYNCSSIESFPNNYNGKIINAWLKAGYAVVCVEKSGNGDSQNCPPCVEVDFQTDIETYAKAYEYMRSLPFADTARLFLWGHSMGGVIAPVIAERYQPKGVMAFATVFRPWNEFLLEMHRVQAPLEGKSYVETEAFVRAMHKIYYEFFILKKSPEALYAIPEYRDLVVKELDYKPNATLQWGRHWRFWQQIDELDLAQSWSNYHGKVLSIFGGADHIQCAEIEQKLIVETINSRHPGNATYLRIEDIDHLMSVNHSWAESNKNLFDNAYHNTHFNTKIAEQTIAWLKQTSDNKTTDNE